LVFQKKMSEESKIWQCPICNRQHDNQGNLARLRLGVPEFRRCYRHDCADVAATMMAARRTNFRPRPVSREKLAAVHRGCPQDDERIFDTSELSHRDHVKVFEATAGPRDERVLVTLRKSFDERNPGPPYLPGNPGDWCTGFYLLKFLAIKAANSCASRLRHHPFLMENNLTIDSSQVPAAERISGNGRTEWWRYRLCHRDDAEWLKREANRNLLREQGQMTIV
jgi:hypothetical protein